MAEVERVVETTNPSAPVVERHNPGFKLELLILWLMGIIDALLAIRIILELLGANRDNGFATLIFDLTAPFVVPFITLFSYRTQYGISQFDLPALVAIIVVTLIGYGLSRLVRIGRV